MVAAYLLSCFAKFKNKPLQKADSFDEMEQRLMVKNLLDIFCCQLMKR
jgi:hypothetical protein